MMLASSAGGVQRAVAVLCTLVVMPAVLHALGTAKFGIWGAATSLAWLASLVDIGTGYALVTLVARSMALGQVQQARREIGGALTLGTYLAAPLLLIVVLAWAGGAGRNEGAVYLIAAAALALNIPLHAASNIFMALQEGYYASLWEFIQTVLTSAGLLAATLVTHDVRIYVWVTFGGLMVSNIGCLVHLFLAHPELRPERLPQPLSAVREVASSGIMYCLMMVAGGLSYLLDNVLALQWLGPEAAAQMAIATRICITIISLLVVISQPLWPAFTDAAHRDDRPWILRSAMRSGAILIGVSVAGCGVLVLCGEPLLRLWLRQNLGIGRPLLWAVAAWIVTQTMMRMPNLLLNSLSLVRFQVVLYAIATAIVMVLKYVLAQTIGVAGILWATNGITLLVSLPAVLWRIRHWVRHPEEKETIQLSPVVEETTSRLY